MALMKRLAYCINSKTKSIDFGDPFAEEITYKVVVKTGNTKAAGTDADVKIQLIGEDSSTKPTKIDNFFRDDFERGNSDKFIIKMKNIGTPLLCKLLIKDKGLSPDWYVEYVKVIMKSKEYFFPFYEWVTDGATTAEGTAYLPQNDSLEVKRKFREEYLRKQRTTYRWRAEPEKEDLTYGLNGHLQAEQHRDLPRNSQWSAERDAEFHNCRATGLKNLLLNRFVGIFRNFDSLEDVHKLLLIPTMKNREINHDCWHNWRSDLEFARQQINGCRPTGVQRVFKSLPKYYSIPTADLEKCLPSGVTYQNALLDGRIFMVDNSILEGIPCGDHPILKTKNYTCAPLLVLYCNNEGFLEPLAIQLFSNKEENNPVFTPKDPPNAWLLAKMFFNSANGQIQQVTEHLLRCHLAPEPFVVAMIRNLSIVHPLRKLLATHTPFHLALNTIGREMGEGVPGANTGKTTSLGGGGHLELLKRGFKKWSIEDFDVPKCLARRGVLDSKIKEYGYRDDSLLYWSAIKKYTRRIIELYYKSDSDVVQDSELQDFMKESKKFGFAYADDDKLPNELSTKDELIHLLTGIIFMSSVQHAAEGNPMFDIYGNPPAHPVLLRQPAPVDKDKVTMEDIMNTLPDQDLMCAQMAVSHTLSTPPADEVFLGEFPMKLFTEESAIKILEEFTQDVKDIGKKINERNKSWRVPYEYLLPENVPARIDM